MSYNGRMSALRFRKTLMLPGRTQEACQWCQVAYLRVGLLIRLIRATHRGSRTNKQTCGHVRGKTCELITKTAHEPRVLRCIRCAEPRRPVSAMVGECAWPRGTKEGGGVWQV